MPIVLERTGGKPVEEALPEMNLAAKIMLLEELVSVYNEWLTILSEVLTGHKGIQKEIPPYDVDIHFQIMKTMEKLYATSDAYKALHELIRALTQE